jgi:glutamate N-acetyltransferase/amino-acid N-acetyltransferase
MPATPNSDSALLAAPQAIPGVRLGTAAAGIKYADRDDLVVIECEAGTRCAAVYTQNAFCAAPVRVAREHGAIASPRYLLINSGNANAGTGEQGYRDAVESCKALAGLGECAVTQVLPYSTGVIGQPLPTSRMAAAMPHALENLSCEGWERAARAIMTTDTVPKLHSVRVDLDGTPVTLTGMAKGSGMIHPNMATMLAYLATDAAVEPEVLQRCLNNAVAPSFNSITVDGDTSTNDACVLLATAKAPNPAINDIDSPAGKAFQQALTALCMELARDIVRDGEGATKLVEVHISGAADLQEARQVGFTIAHSPLVKTALFASDPNWGRILAAVGRAGIQQLEIDKVRICLGEVEIVNQGGLSPGYTEAAGQGVMDQSEIPIIVELGRGQACTTILTCDFSYDYVKINAEYRT